MKARTRRLRRPSAARILAYTVFALVACVASPAVVVGGLPVRGVALAALLAGTLLVCTLAWRERRSTERTRQAAELGQAMRHAEQLRAERARQLAVVGTLSARLGELRAQLDQARTQSSQLQQQLSTLRGNHEALRVELELQAVLAAGTPEAGGHRSQPAAASSGEAAGIVGVLVRRSA